jgi:hypothetical protein
VVNFRGKNHPERFFAGRWTKGGKAGEGGAGVGEGKGGSPGIGDGISYEKGAGLSGNGIGVRMPIMPIECQLSEQANSHCRPQPDGHHVHKAVI